MADACSADAAAGVTPGLGFLHLSTAAAHVGSGGVRGAPKGIASASSAVHLSFGSTLAVPSSLGPVTDTPKNSPLAGTAGTARTAGTAEQLKQPEQLGQLEQLGRGGKGGAAGSASFGRRNLRSEVASWWPPRWSRGSESIPKG